jgi:hypoxanthine phosphoribosyltransferase
MARRPPPRRPAITEPDFDVLLAPAEIAARVEACAGRLAPRLQQGEWTAIVILLGATPFAADLLRALAGQGVHPHFDAIWLESYHDARTSSGRVAVRADVSRQVAGRGVLLIDDVFDTGRTIAFARQHLLAQGAREVVTCVFARKPDAAPAGLDAWAWDAPDRFLVGYGMDDAGRWRGLPYLGAVK